MSAAPVLASPWAKPHHRRVDPHDFQLLLQLVLLDVMLDVPENVVVYSRMTKNTDKRGKFQDNLPHHLILAHGGAAGDPKPLHHRRLDPVSATSQYLDAQTR